MSLPPRIKHKSDKAEKGRRSPAHRAWVRGHACAACGATAAIECAHVRVGTDGGTGINMRALATEFFRKSPHRGKLEA